MPKQITFDAVLPFYRVPRRARFLTGEFYDCPGDGNTRTAIRSAYSSRVMVRNPIPILAERLVIDGWGNEIAMHPMAWCVVNCIADREVVYIGGVRVPAHHLQDRLGVVNHMQFPPNQIAEFAATIANGL